MPEECVQLLKESGNWDTPYKYAKPNGYKVVDGPIPKDFNRLTRSFTYASLEDLESQCQDKRDEDELNVHCEEDKTADKVMAVRMKQTQMKKWEILNKADLSGRLADTVMAV